MLRENTRGGEHYRGNTKGCCKRIPRENTGEYKGGDIAQGRILENTEREYQMFKGEKMRGNYFLIHS